ncbi:hypothetical protein BDR03DRAFT_945153, partial [Suillus americanus]
MRYPRSFYFFRRIHIQVFTYLATLVVLSIVHIAAGTGEESQLHALIRVIRMQSSSQHQVSFL